MPKVRISGWVAAAGLALGGCSETRVAPESEACLGADESPATVDYAELGMPSGEPDLQAWVVVEQHGMTRVTTRPCDSRPSTRMLLVLPEARVVFAEDGRVGTFSDIRAGQKVSVWYHGGAKGKTRSLVVERAELWPPGSAPEASAGSQEEEAPAEEEAAAPEPEATPPS